MESNTPASVNYYEKFYSYLNELLQSYTKLADLLRQKLSAVSKFDIAALDGIIKDEQVYVMLSRGFDSNVASFRDKLSLKGDSLTAVIEELPEEYQPKYRLLFTHLKSKLDEVKGLNEKCQALIEERLYTIEKSIRQLDGPGASYAKPGAAKPAGDTHMLHKSV